MDFITILGLIAAVCTTASFFPQAIKVYQTKHTKDLSLATYAVMTLGIFLWLAYGILLSNIPLIAANVISLAVSSFILGMKIKYK